MEERKVITVNGVEHQATLPADASLLAFLRERLGLTGTKGGCGAGECGACTVLLDDAPVHACMTPVGAALGRRVLTIEGLARDGRLHPLQQAFLAADAFQCGYCTPGMIMAGVGLLTRDPDPDDRTIVAAMNGNLCRCGMYARIVRAIQLAAAELRATTAGGRDDSQV